MDIESPVAFDRPRDEAVDLVGIADVSLGGS